MCNARRVLVLRVMASIPFDITGLFAAGGLMGLFLGQWLSRWLPSSISERVFPVAILIVAGFVIVKNL